MKKLRGGLCALVLAAGLTAVAACSSPSGPTTGPAPGATTGPSASSGTTAGAPSARPSADPSQTTAGSPSAEPSGQAPKPAPTTRDQPVPKVQRGNDPAKPSASAKPVSTEDTVRYPDGIALTIRSIKFDKETQKGPGSFPGREFAVLTLEVKNKSKKNLALSSVVVTVLDKAGNPVAPVYTDEAKVQDFSGTLAKGKTVQAKYAFAVPKSSRSKVTVVVDFDGVHTSAVFRGKLR